MVSGEAVQERELAFRYAFEYMKLHAEQRQSAFRFYLISIGALATAIISGSKALPHWMIGVALILASFFFWRLDTRNSQLVKAAERYLEIEEARMAQVLDDVSICIMKDGEDRKRAMWLRCISSYTQVHRWIFGCVALVGLLLAAAPIIQWHLTETNMTGMETTSFLLRHAEQSGAILVLLGLVVSMFLGTPQSRVGSGVWSVGEVDERKLRIHNALTFVGPAISALGCAAYIVAAFSP